MTGCMPLEKKKLNSFARAWAFFKPGCNKPPVRLGFFFVHLFAFNFIFNY